MFCLLKGIEFFILETQGNVDIDITILYYCLFFSKL